MTDHEWVDWIIEQIDKGECVWEPELKQHPVFGEYYKGIFRGWKYIFIPRKTKQGVAEWRHYDNKKKDAEIIIHESHSQKQKDYYKKIYSPENYDDTLGGFFMGGVKNSKVHKIEKAIKRQIESRGICVGYVWPAPPERKETESESK